jgi:hypothetical protein
MRRTEEHVPGSGVAADDVESGVWSAAPRAKTLPAFMLDGSKVPWLIFSRVEARRLAGDARTRWVLAFIDGSACVDVVIESCGLPARDAALALVDLVTKRVIALR